MIKLKTDQIIKLISAIVITQLAGAIGSIFTFPAITTWYAALEKPFFTPPDWIFAPVWTILFLLMGISLYLVWDKGFKRKISRIALSLFSIQLALNIMWSFLFFGLKSPFYAFIEIIVLWIAIALTIITFNKISRTAAVLLIPYILWASFAMMLNFSIWQLN